MILINYGTNEHYEKSVWDKLYCKSFRSAKQELKRQLEIDWLNKDQKKIILNQFDMRVLNKKTMMSCWNANIKLESEDLYIDIDEINLV